MKQREIETRGLTWTCVQALAGVTGDAADAAQQKMDASGEVIVVCTPSGAARSVRLRLAPDWLDTLSDDELASAIAGARQS